MKLTYFMMLKTLPAWLALSRRERRDFTKAVVEPILAAHPATRLRYYDAEAFSGRCTDIAVFETDQVQDYHDLVEALRDTAFFNAPYYEVVDIIPAVEGGYQGYDERIGAV
jgi:hypothetical protein